MGLDLKAEIALSCSVCDRCRQKEIVTHSIDRGNLNIIFNMNKLDSGKVIPSSLFSVKVDIKRIRICKEMDGRYSAKAKIEVKCPKCNNAHILEDVIEVPRIVFEKMKKCDICGAEMVYFPDMIDIEDKDGDSVVNASGILRCSKCNNEEKNDNFTGTISESKTRDEWIVSSGRNRTMIL